MIRCDQEPLEVGRRGLERGASAVESGVATSPNFIHQRAQYSPSMFENLDRPVLVDHVEWFSSLARSRGLFGSVVEDDGAEFLR